MNFPGKTTSPCHRADVPIILPFAQQQYIASEQRGFTLVELIVVSAILGVLITIGIPAYSSFVNKAKISKCIGDILTIQKDIYAFTIENRALPVNLDKVNWGNFRDPWGNLYEYSPVAARGDGVNPLNTDFDLFSKGKDGLTSLNVDLINPPSTPLALDDIFRAGEGGYIGTGGKYVGSDDGY